MFLATGRPAHEPEWMARDIEVSEESRLRHQYGIGMTGSGKTAYLLTQIYQDIQAGNGFTVVDVEESLAKTVLSYLAEANWPPEKLIYINPTLDRVIPLNVLKTIEHPHTAIEDVVATMKRAWWDSWGPRLEDYLRHALSVLQQQELTLGELTDFVSNERFRSKVLAKVADPAILNYFLYHLGNISKSQYRLLVESTRNKAAAFTENPFIAPIISAEDCFDFKVAMDEGYAVVVDIPERLLKDSAKLLAMLILARIQGASLQRTSWTRPHFVTLDEFQGYASRHVIEMLTRARKRGIGLTVANQNLVQVPFDKDPSFLSTVLANCNTIAMFQLGRDDAEKLVRHCFHASGTEAKRQKEHWLWGPQGEPSFYSVQEEYQDYLTELTDQEVRECVIRLKDEQETYFCTTYDMPPAEADSGPLVAAALRHHGLTKQEVLARRKERIERFTVRRKPVDNASRQDPQEA